MESEMWKSMKHSARMLAALALIAVAGAQAQQATDDHSTHHAAPASTPQTEGEVRKVDMELGKVTLRHGPITNLDMPAMTMVFSVTDKKLLEHLQPGDKVRFTAIREGGKIAITDIQPAD